VKKISHEQARAKREDLIDSMRVFCAYLFVAKNHRKRNPKKKTNQKKIITKSGRTIASKQPTFAQDS
jgi:hypothetical protein